MDSIESEAFGGWRDPIPVLAHFTCRRNRFSSHVQRVACRLPLDDSTRTDRTRCCNATSVGEEAKSRPSTWFEGLSVQASPSEVCSSSRLLDLSASLRLERHDPNPKEFDARAAIHGALQGFQPVDLALYLTIAPRQRNGIADRGEITS